MAPRETLYSIKSLYNILNDQVIINSKIVNKIMNKMIIIIKNKNKFLLFFLSFRVIKFFSNIVRLLCIMGWGIAEQMPI